MVGIMRIEPVHEDFDAVRPVIFILIHQQTEVGFLREIDAFGSKLKTHGQVEAVGKDDLLVRLSVAIGVLEDE